MLITSIQEENKDITNENITMTIYKQPYSLLNIQVPVKTHLDKDKNIEKFRKNKHSRGGYLFTCKICYAAEARLKYQKNIIQERNRSKIKYKNNKNII